MERGEQIERRAGSFVPPPPAGESYLLADLILAEVRRLLTTSGSRRFVEELAEAQLTTARAVFDGLGWVLRALGGCHARVVAFEAVLACWLPAGLAGWAGWLAGWAGCQSCLAACVAGWLAVFWRVFVAALPDQRVACPCLLLSR